MVKEMRLNLFTIYCSLIFLLLGCAFNSDKKFIDTTDTELIKTFDIEEDKFKQFQVEEFSGFKEETSLEEEPEEEKIKEIKKTNDKKKVTSKKKIIKSPKKEKTSRRRKRKALAKTPKSLKKKVIGKKKPKDSKKKPKIAEKKKEDLIPEELRKTFLSYDKKSKRVWDVFSPRIFPGEETLLKIKFLGLTAGFVKMTTHSLKKINNRLAYHFIAKLKTARYYSYIYSLEDSVETFVDKENFKPIKYTLIQRESGQSVDDLQLFDMDAQKTYHWYRREKKGKLKKYKKVGFVPKYLQDSFSVLFFVRGLPLKIGDTYSFPIVTRAKIWLLDMKVIKHESIKVNGKYVPAIKIKAKTRFPGVLKKKGDILFWYSRSKERKLLKFEAKVKIGSIEGDLVDYKPGQN